MKYVQYYHASISWISPYFLMFLMFHNIVLFIIVQHQFADASRQAAALTRMITRAEALRLAQCQCGCQAAAIICTETRLGSGPSESESRADAGWHLSHRASVAPDPCRLVPAVLISLSFGLSAHRAAGQNMATLSRASKKMNKSRARICSRLY